ncbi:MAG: adenosylmethionine--8-amino-7-oxononanoate aminotransferase BioA, partial [Rhodococcus sp.]|nr:adenosylmethionine--8-amino-7-oxononanoate aminotransferase BioA [Rhodococcus sp. (in: high G+C Gram-positive bacteria)]
MLTTGLDPHDVSAIDADVLWHPYGSFPASTRPLIVDSAQGATLTLSDGRRLVDGMSSWWAGIHGYPNPVLDTA